jgi:hypothetical protein
VANRRPDGLAVFVSPRVLDATERKIMNSPDKSEEQQRQIKIDADIDEVIKTIQGLGLKPDEKTTANDSRDEEPSHSRNRWMRSAVIAITIFAIGAFAGFAGVYNLHALSGAGNIRVIRPWEIRRAIPVQPEIRRAIPVELEVRKAIPVHRTRAGARRQNFALTAGTYRDSFPSRGMHAREPMNGSRQLVTDRQCCPFRQSVCQHRLTLFSSARVKAFPRARAWNCSAERRFPQFPASYGRFFVTTWMSNLVGTVSKLDLTCRIEQKGTGNVIFSTSAHIKFPAEQTFERTAVSAAALAVQGARTATTLPDK